MENRKKWRTTLACVNNGKQGKNGETGLLTRAGQPPLSIAPVLAALVARILVQLVVARE